MKLGINERLKGKKLYKEVWKPVVLLDTGKKYESISEASRRTGVEISAIQYCCNGKLKTAGGYTFKYLTEEGDN